MCNIAFKFGQMTVLKGATDEVSKWTRQKQLGALNVATEKAARNALRKQKKEDAARKKRRLKATLEIEHTYGFDFGPIDPHQSTSLYPDLAVDIVLENFDLAHKKNDGVNMQHSHPLIFTFYSSAKFHVET